MARKPSSNLRLVDAAHPPPASANVTDQIVEAVTTAIVERRLMPGTHLVEQQIADLFSVSRTVVRQALNRLSRDRLVTLEPARGAVVAMPSIDEARQVFQVRRLLEGGMVRALAAQITDAQVARLRAHLRSEQSAVGRATSRAGRGCWPTSTWCWRARWATRCWHRCWPTCCRARSSSR